MFEHVDRIGTRNTTRCWRGEYDGALAARRKAGNLNDSMCNLNDHAKIKQREESIHEPFLGRSEAERIGGQLSRDSDPRVEWTRCTRCLMCS
jgi:hypothetical protein